MNLEPLRFELPHLQVAGLRIADLRAGKFPAGGDELWRDNLEAAAASWAGPPPAPPMAQGPFTGLSRRSSFQRSR
jgi:peptidoglycan L-alanyl-D-glutamate endopeptidase CwlK